LGLTIDKVGKDTLQSQILAVQMLNWQLLVTYFHMWYTTVNKQSNKKSLITAISGPKFSSQLNKLKYEAVSDMTSVLHTCTMLSSGTGLNTARLG